MIYISNPFILPLLIVIWSADVWLWLTCVRFVLAKLSPDSQLTTALSKLTDPLPEKAGKVISGWSKKQIATKAAWAVTIISVLVLRYMLISLVLLLSPK